MMTIFLYRAERARKPKGEQEGEKVKERCTVEKETAPHLLRVFSSTHADINTVVKCR